MKFLKRIFSPDRTRASEERYRLISQMSSDYTFSTALDAKGNMYLNWVAGAFQEITGYTYEEYVASGGWQGHLHPEDREQDEQDMEIIRRNQRNISEVRTFKKNGEMRWVRVYAQPIWDDKANRLTGIVGAVQDITERKQAEEALTRERDLLQIFLDNIPDAVYFKDTASRFIRINKAQVKFLKLDRPEDAIGKSDLDFQPPELAKKFMQEEQQIVETGRSAINRVEFNPTDSGEPRWLAASKAPVKDSTGHIIGTIGISRDITKQKQAEEREEHRRQLLEKVIMIGKKVTEAKNLQTTLEQIWHSVRHNLEFDRLGIYLYDPKNNSINGSYGTNEQGEMVDEWKDRIFLSEDTPETKTFVEVLENENGIYFTHQYNLEHDTQANPRMGGVKDYAAVAAWAGNKPVAVLCVDNATSQKPITNERLEALRLFAGFAGLAIENSQLNESLQRELDQQKRSEENEANRRSMLEKVILLGQSVTEVKDLKITIERIWHGVHDDIGFDRLAIFLYDQETNTVNGTLGTDNEGRVVEEWNYKRTLDHEKPTSFMRALEQPNGLFYTNNFGVEFEIPEEHDMHDVKDFAAVSAWAGDRPVAIITVDNAPSGRTFTQAQLEALRLFGGYAGLAIQNSKLNAALQTELNQRQNLIHELENKNAELERFTYTVSHDLKSPLVTITGFLGYLEQDATNGNKERVKSGIDRISRAAKKMQALLNDLLELSRIGRIMNTPEDVPFEEIVNEAIDRVHGSLNEIDAFVEIQTGFPVIHGDRIRLVEVVQNLVENAVKYANPEVRLRIEIGMDGYNERGCPIFHVRDNGIGIEPQYHENIFGLFNKLDTQSEGTGIGLSLVKRIIEVHHGRIWVESEKGKGATFYFSLPSPQTKE